VLCGGDAIRPYWPPEKALKHGDKLLVGNKGYARFLKNPKEHFVIDEDEIDQEARCSGIKPEINTDKRR